MESIERYKELRAALRSLNNRLLDCFSSGARAKEQITATARELGYKVEGGNILFATEDAKHRL